MATMTFDEFLTNVFNTAGLDPATIAYKGTIQVLTPTNGGRVMVREPIWCFAERDVSGQWNIDPYGATDLYLMARWVTRGYGRNTTGEGPVRTEAEKDVFALVCRALDNVCPAFSRTQADKLSQEIAAGTMGEQGHYEETVGDGVLEEYEFTYAYRAVKLRSLYQWLIDNGLLAAVSWPFHP